MRRLLRPTVALVMVAALLGVTLGVGSAGGGEVKPTHHDRNRFFNDLRASEEVPPADDGRGLVKLKLRPSTGEVCFSVAFRKTGTPNRGHIHVGDKGANGGIVVPLFELVGMPTDARNDALENGHLSDCVTADPALLETIKSDPTGYYVNLHNARFPAGSMRCQLVDP